MQNKIDKLRRDIGVLSNYLKDHRKASSKLKRKIDEIIVFRLGTIQIKELNDKLTLHLDTLKQKLAVYTSRIRRYTEGKTRRKQNALFNSNERSFYKTLRKRIELDQSYAIDELETSRFWSQIWEAPKNYNERPFWLDQIKENAERIPEMDRVEITEETV